MRYTDIVPFFHLSFRFISPNRVEVEPFRMTPLVMWIDAGSPDMVAVSRVVKDATKSKETSSIISLARGARHVNNVNIRR